MRPTRSLAAKALQLPRLTEVSRWCAGALGAALLLCSDPASAASSSKVGEFTASGLLFKDTIEVASIEDPDSEPRTGLVQTRQLTLATAGPRARIPARPPARPPPTHTRATPPQPVVEGATIYVTEYKRSLTDRLANDPFSDPAQASVTCAATGPVRVKDAAKLRSQKDGSEVFEERKGINIIQNKRLRVRRLYDADHDTLIYISYSTAITKESSAVSVCVCVGECV